MSRTRTLQDRYDRTETLNNITLFCLFVDCELVDFEEVVQDKRWRGAIDKEIRSIKKNDT